MNFKELLDTLVAVARSAHSLADNVAQDAATGDMTIGFKSDFEELSKALDKLDELPDPPMEAATGPRKAEYWLARWTVPLADQADVTSMGGVHLRFDDYLEDQRRIGLLSGALVALRWSVDESTKKKIDEVLEHAGQDWVKKMK
jgi:hypothetical protein